MDGSKWILVGDNVYPVLKTIGVGDGYYLKKIVDLELKKGVYRLRLENKIARHQFYERKVAVSVQHTYMGK